ncbi:MAG: PHP domain-containing protein [Erysipelotrichaceae bacterium]|nr:PHP domain-containing protein [Erysipelotrichaceae bacterium]
MVYADLHVHTAYSDGIHTIEEVIRMEKEHGTKVVAIADHDTVFHYDLVKAECEKQGIEAVRAVEMSCYDEKVHKKIHIVGLWLNDNPTHVEALCSHTLKCRDAYHRHLIEELNEKGIMITYEDAKKYAKYNIVFKMHLFMALTEKYPEYNNKEKYRELFAGKTSYETDAQMGYIDIREGIQAILQDGGIPVIAHPCEYDNYDQIEEYVSYGLKGIEISHPRMQEEDYPKTKEFAKRFDLVESGGSDFHSMLLTNIGEFGLTKEQYETLKRKANK